MLTPDEFLAALRWHLHARSVPFEPADLALWAKSVWPLVEGAHEAQQWADAYCVALAEAVRLAGPVPESAAGPMTAPSREPARP